jgi:hypothetical protein
MKLINQLLLASMLFLPCTAQSEEEKPVVVALNFSNFQLTLSPISKKKTVAEEPPYYLLLENGDRLLAENNDLIEREHL